MEVILGSFRLFVIFTFLDKNILNNIIIAFSYKFHHSKSNFQMNLVIYVFMFVFYGSFVCGKIKSS